MAIYFIILLCWLCSATLITAFPTRISREAPDPITVTQTPVGGNTSYSRNAVPGNCIDIQQRFQNNATKIEIMQPGSYRLVTFKTACNARDSIEIKTYSLIHSQEIVLNERNPICSFMLTNNEAKPVPITFSSGAGKLIKQVISEQECTNICSPGDRRWAYSSSIEFTVNNGIRLFSSTECENIKGTVHGTTNLVDITLKDKRHVKSFIIIKKD